MQLYILNPQYEIIGMIDDAESILWNKKYNDAGYCEIYIPCDTDMFSLLARGNYIYRYDDDMFCKIEAPEIETSVDNGNFIIAPANDIASVLLSGRIVRWQIIYSGTVVGFIKKLLYDSIINPEQSQRKIANFELDESNFNEFPETIEVSAFTDDLFALIKTTCKSYNYGFRLSYDITRDKYVFKLYKGKNKALIDGDEYVEFSPTYANIVSSKYKEDESGYKNVVYVSYTADDENETVHLLSLYDGATEPSGENRREVFVSGTDIKRDVSLDELISFYEPLSLTKVTSAAYAPPDANADKRYWHSRYYAEGIVEPIATSWRELTEEEENSLTADDLTYHYVTIEYNEAEKITMTDYTFFMLVRNKGKAKLAECKTTQHFEGEIDTINTYTYKGDYNLGDIVKVKNEYGIEADARIVEVMESIDGEDGHTVEPVFEYLS